MTLSSVPLKKATLCYPKSTFSIILVPIVSILLGKDILKIRVHNRVGNDW